MWTIKYEMACAEVHISLHQRKPKVEKIAGRRNRLKAFVIDEAHCVKNGKLPSTIIIFQAGKYIVL